MRRGLEFGVKSGFFLEPWPDPKPTGQDLYAFREKMGMTQHQASEWFGKGLRTIIRWEQLGHRFVIPDAAMAREIDNFLRQKIRPR